MTQTKPYYPVPRQDPLPYYTLTPRTLAICLAYIQRHIPRRLSGRRLLSPSHLTRLTQWIDQPAPGIRSIRAHPTLAAHLTLLIAADLLAVAEHALHPSRSVMEWLILSPVAQIDRLLQAIRHTKTWPATINSLGWSDILTLDKVAYLEQMLMRQRETPPVAAAPAVWQAPSSPDAWELSLPGGLPVWLLFDLLQLGQRLPDGSLRLTPLSIASHPVCHYGYDHIRWLLETATQTPLPAAQQRQLQSWLRRAHAYRIHGPLLSVARPQHLQKIYQNRRLRPCLLEQISPRHALINPALIPKLRRWLARRGYPLNQPPPPAPTSAAPPPANSEDLDLPTHWFSLRLLLGLQKYLPLPLPAPAAQLFRLEQTLPPAAIAELEQLAQHTLQQLDNVIQGRDAFFPARQSPTPHLIHTLQTAIAHGSVLHIAYRAAASRQDKWHAIEPLRLESRANLAYLHAYSRRAQANRTFRLDRITAVSHSGLESSEETADSADGADFSL